MSETKHTPGPWTVNDQVAREDCLYIEAARVGVATVYSDNTPTVDESRANARLIAAAPDMLAALKREHGCATLADDGTCLGCAVGDLIAKAESR
jgi:hypothetical protein